MAFPGSIIITGANGFIGSEVLRCLRDKGVPGSRIVAVVREKHAMDPRQRMDQVFSRWVRAGAVRQVASLAEFGDGIRCVTWADLREVLASQAAGHPVVIVHCAADTAFDLTLAESRRINVGLTAKVIEAVMGASPAGGPGPDCRVIHVSTAFVAGKRRGFIREGEPDTGERRSSDFNNAYEQSKWEAECLVRASGIPWTIVRPSIVVGDSRSGFTLHFRVVYSVIRLWLRDVVPRAPVARDARIDIVPSDFVASAIVRLCELPVGVSAGKTLHLCSGADAPGPVDVMAAAGRAFGRKPLPLSPPWVLRFLLSRPVLAMCGHSMREILTTLAWHVPYLGSRGRVFDTAVAREVLGETHGTSPGFKDYGDRLFDYCAKTSWGHKCSTST